MLRYSLLVVLICLGAIAAWDDFKIRKIKNELIVAGLAAGIILYAVGWFGGAVSVHYVFGVAVNALVALALGYGFWYFDLWAAGDAKLFFVLALLLPWKFYWRSYLPVFPSLVILVNAFIPLLVFVFLQSAFLMIKNTFLFFRQEGARVKLEGGMRKFGQQIKINYLSYLWVALVFGCVFIIFQLMRLEMGGFINKFALGRAGLFFLMAFLGMLASRVAKNKKLILSVAAILILYIAVRRSFYPQNLLPAVVQASKNSIPYLAGLGLLSWMFSLYEKNSQNKSLHFAFWLFLGVTLTMVFNGSLISVWR